MMDYYKALEDLGRKLADVRDEAKRVAQAHFQKLARQEESLRDPAVSKIQNAAMARAGLYWYNDPEYREEFKKVDGPFMERIATHRLARDEAEANADMEYHTSMAKACEALRDVIKAKREEAEAAGQ